MATTRLITADDLWRMPDDGYRYDLVQGELIRMAPAGGEHGEIANEVGRRIGNYVREHGLGRVFGAETGFLLARDPDVILGPDAAFVRTDRLPPPDQRRGFVPVAPDLAVEIVSPGDRRGEIQRKVNAYLAAGVPQVWTIYPRRRTVHVHGSGQPVRVLSAHDTLDGEEILPGFQLPVAALFE